MFKFRLATLDDLEVLVQLRLDLLREVGDFEENTDTAALKLAIAQYLSEKLPKGEFFAWVAEIENQIVARACFQTTLYAIS